LGAGLAAACGLRPFLPVLLAGALGSAKALGVSFSHGSFHFLQSGWWLAAPAGARSPGLPSAAPTVLSFWAKDALFGGWLAPHGDFIWACQFAAFSIV